METLKSKLSAEKIWPDAQEACRLLKDGDAKSALRRMNRCVRMSHEGWALLLRSRIKQRLGLDHLAIADVTRAFDRDPDCGWIFDMPLERLELPASPWARTLYRLNRGFRKETGSYAVHAFIGKLKTMRGLGKEGLRHLDWAVRRKPRQAYLLTWRAEIKRRLKLESAERDLKAALRLDSRQAVAHAAYAALLREKKKYGPALEHARSAWKFSSTYETGPLEAARIYLAQGEARGTFLWLERAVRRANRYGWRSLYEFGGNSILEGLGRLSQDQALKDGRWKSRWLAWHGEALLGLGQNKEAAVFLQEALRRDPHFAWAWAWLGEAHLNCGNPDESESAFKQGVRRDPAYTRGWLGLGRLELARGREQKALEALNRAVKIDPAWALSRYWRAEALKKLGRAGEARIDLDKALRLDPRFEQAKRARQDLG